MTGQCPGCGEQRRLNTAGLIRSHARADGQQYPGTHEKPGKPRPMRGPCPRPDKARFATLGAARQRALGRPAIVGLVLSPYECRCGWVHLTSRAEAVR